MCPIRPDRTGPVLLGPPSAPRRGRFGSATVGQAAADSATRSCPFDGFSVKVESGACRFPLILPNLMATETRPPSILRPLVEELHDRRARARLGGGEEKIARQHEAGQLTARERIDLLGDPG